MGGTHDIEFRPVQESDFPLLTQWLSEPHVREFYQSPPITLEAVALEYGPFVRAEEPTICHLALSDGGAFAYLQCYRNADYPDRAELIGMHGGISIDLFIGNPTYLHAGYGRAALCAYLERVAFPYYPTEADGYIAHASANVAALHCSEAVGFRKIRTFVEDGVEMVLLTTTSHGRQE